MMTIWEKLARCSSPGEIQRMCEGTNFELMEKAEIERLRELGKEVAMDALREKQAKGIHPTTGHPIIELLRACGAVKSDSKTGATDG